MGVKRFALQYIIISPSTISRYIDNFHYSLKRVSIVPIRRNTPETLALRREYAFRIYHHLFYKERSFLSTRLDLKYPLELVREDPMLANQLTQLFLVLEHVIYLYVVLCQ